MLPIDVQLAKIKRDPKSEKIEISIETQMNEGTLTGSYETKALPHPHFVVAMQKLRAPFIEICQLSGAATPADVDVRTLSLSHPADGGCGVIITAVRTLKNGQAMTLNTPLMFLEQGEGNEDDARLLPERTTQLIDRVVDEARLFLSGKKRGQVEMFGEEKEEGWDQGPEAWRGEVQEDASGVTVPPAETTDSDDDDIFDL